MAGLPGGVALIQGANRGLGLGFCRFILNKYSDSIGAFELPEVPRTLHYVLVLYTKFHAMNKRLMEIASDACPTVGSIVSPYLGLVVSESSYNWM